MQIAGTVRRHIYEHMPRNTAHSDHTSCMLDCIIRINELCSDTAHFRTLTHSKHFFQPVWIDRFYIIIQKKQIFSLCMRRSKVINGRIIKFFSPSQKMDLTVSGKLFIISENLISGTVILHDYDFKILITGILLQHFQTGLKSLFLVFVWYDNRHQRFSLHRIFHPVKAQILCMAYLAFRTCSLKMSFYCSLAGFKCVHFTGRIICSGGFVCSPVIQDFRNM